MSYEKSWSFSINQTPATQGDNQSRMRSFLYGLKVWLVSLGWTVEQSCTGSSIASSDLWSSVSSIASHTEGSNHGWATLKSPAGLVAGPSGSYTGDQSRLWLTLSAVAASTNQGLTDHKVVLHRVSPTGGATNTTPSSTDQLLFSDNAGFSGGNGLFHFGGISSGHFYALHSATGAGYMRYGLCLPPLGAVETIVGSGLDIPYGVIFWAGSATATPGVFTQGQLTISQSARTWHGDGTTAAGNARVMALGNGASGWIGAGFPSSGDSVNGRQPYGQLHVQTETTAKTSYVGRIADIFGSGAGTPQGSVDNVSTPGWQFMGSLWLPTNAVMGM